MGRRSWIVTTGVSVVTAVVLIVEGGKRRIKARRNQHNSLADLLVHHHVRSDLEAMIRSVQHHHGEAANDNYRLMTSVRAALTIGDETTVEEIKNLISSYQATRPDLDIVFDKGQRRIHVYTKTSGN